MSFDKIILIASREYSQPEIRKYNKINHKKALIVIFNTCSSSQGKLFGGKYHKRFLRGFGRHLGNGYLIKGNVRENAEHYVWRQSNIQHIKENNELKMCFPLEYDRTLTGMERPSLGYIAYDILKKEFKNIPMLLVGFTFEGWNGHDWKEEKQRMFNDKRVVIF